MTSACAIVCLDVNGQADGNHGPFKGEVRYMAGASNAPIQLGKIVARVLMTVRSTRRPDRLRRTGAAYSTASTRPKPVTSRRRATCGPTKESSDPSLAYRSTTGCCTRWIYRATCVASIRRRAPSSGSMTRTPIFGARRSWQTTRFTSTTKGRDRDGRGQETQAFADGAAKFNGLCDSGRR